MKRVILISTVLAWNISVRGQESYHIRIDVPEKEIIRDHLDLGGSSPAGDLITVNSYFIEWNGRPFFPIIGEFHFSRYPAAYWEESILKMKAGGINTIATYVFWNLHERKEGTFDWQGNLDLRRFIELVEKNGMLAIVRLGPFCHGEMRNGGLPDWLYGRAFEVRSNDPEYLFYVDRLYGQIADQIRGKLFKEGGPVIAVQFENEYQHSAAPWEFSYPGGPKEYTVADWQASLAHEQITVTDGVNPWADYGRTHMAKLKEIAQQHGLEVPLYTATGWGNAAIVERGCIPVTACYVYPFWAPPAPSPFYLFKDIHQYPDYMPVSYDASLYPSIPAEIGPGIQVKYSRRPVVEYGSVLPLMTRIIGSGSNGIGYYMYHGGSTPSFDGKFYNEEVNGLPRINYDFQAPIGQYGQIRPHFRTLKLLHQFLADYGDRLAPMQTILPETNASDSPENTETLRYAVRSSGGSGFLFLLNFQDHLPNHLIDHVRILVEGSRQTFSFPSTGTMNVPVGTSAIFPFNLDLDGTTLTSGTVQPLSILQRENGKHYIFSAVEGIRPEMLFPPGTTVGDLRGAARSDTPSGILITGNPSAPFSFQAGKGHYLVLPESMALNAYQTDGSCLIGSGIILEEGQQLLYLSREDTSALYVYPDEGLLPVASPAALEALPSPLEGLAAFRIIFPPAETGITVTKASERKYEISLDHPLSGLNDLFLEIDYVGDRAMAFIDGKLITDHLYHERIWEIGLKPFAGMLGSNRMVLVFHPMEPGSEYLVDLRSPPEFNGKNYLMINGIRVVPEYKTFLRMQGPK